MLCQVVIRVSKLGPRENLPKDQSTGIDVYLLCVSRVGCPELWRLPIGRTALCVHGRIGTLADSSEPKVIDLGSVVG